MKRLVIAVSFFIVACSSSPVPRGVIAPGQMEKIVIDLMKAEEFINSYAIKDSTININVKRSTLYAQVFRLHQTTREDFYKSYAYYEEHPDKHKIFIDSISATLNKQKAASDKQNYLKPVKSAPLNAR